MPELNVEANLEAWKTTVQVQQHFNDMEMHIRNFAMSVLVAIVGATALALENHAQLLAILVLFGGFIVWQAFRVLDLHYHRLLLAAVAHGEVIESMLLEEVPAIGLATSIRAASPTTIILWPPMESSFCPQFMQKWWQQRRHRGENGGKGNAAKVEHGQLTRKRHSTDRIKLFYAAISWSLLLAFLAVVAFGNK